MNNLLSWTTAALFLFAVLSGCAGKGNGGGTTGGEPDPSTFGSTLYDSSIGNKGYRITGSLGGTAVPLLDAPDRSAVSIQILDEVATDAGGALDKASLILNAFQSDLRISAVLKRMTTAAVAGSVGADFHGGTGNNVPVFGTIGIGGEGLPESNAVIFAAGQAMVYINDAPQDDLQNVVVAVMEGIRDDTGALLPAADPTDLEVHVLFPGAADGSGGAFPGLDEGFLYYYFETVSVKQLSADEKAKVGEDLEAPPELNELPVADAKVLVDGEPATSGTIEEGAGGVLNVVFDASDSLDPDGEITIYSWKIAELNATGVYEPPQNASMQKRSNQTAEYFFTVPGPKLIELTIRDNDGGIDNLTLTFYVDRHLVHESDSKNVHITSASGGPECVVTVNCFPHSFMVHAGIQSGRIELIDNDSAEMTRTHIDFYRPGQDLPSSATDMGEEPYATHATALELSREAFNQTGVVYNVFIWWEAGADVAYHVDILLRYTPSVADA